jgi:hypothetical protein
MTFYRPGGTARAPNRQYDTVYSDVIGGATDWLPVNKGDTLAINIARASIVFNNAAQSAVTPSPVAPEVQVLMELKMYGGDPDAAAWPIDQWQNLVVATSRRAMRAGWARLRIVNINNGDGTGVAMAMQVTRSGSDGVVA